MDKQLIQRILVGLAEEAIPSEGKPWDLFLSKLSVKERIAATGRNENYSIKPVKKQRWMGATVTLVFFLVMAAIFSLPQGRAWAQEIFNYFIRESDQVTLPTPMPVNLVAVTPGVIQPTLTPSNPPGQGIPFYDICGDISEPACSGEQIRKMVEFPVMGISDLPVGMYFVGATGGPDGAILVYRNSESPTSGMLLLQETRATEAAEKAIPVGKSAVIEEVSINNHIGEYVKGSYFNYAGDLTATWKPDSGMQSLRWKEDDMVYSLTLAGTGGLDKKNLILMAASLKADLVLPTHRDVIQENGNLVEVETEAGFQAIKPTWLPENIRFGRASFLADQDAICLEYINENNKSNEETLSTSLSIIESNKALPIDLNSLTFANLTPEQVLLEKATLLVGGALGEKGLFAFGSIDGSRICGSRLQNQVLQIQLEGLNIAILAKASSYNDNGSRDWFTRQEMVRLAEGITGIHTIGEDQIDPDFLTSLDAAQQIASFPLKSATLLPEGVNFFYAQYTEKGAQQDATINYTDGNQNISIQQIKGSSDTLKKIMKRNPQIYESVSVHGSPAILSQGYWDQDGWRSIPNGGDGGASLIWFEDGIEYILGGFNAYPAETWLKIAEGIR